MRSIVTLSAALVALGLSSCSMSDRCCRPVCDPCAGVATQPAPYASVVVQQPPAAPVAPTPPTPPSPPTPPQPPTPPAPPAAPAAAEMPYNATCPVLLGNPVDARYTVDYNGKVVGFCCPMCKAKFLKDPMKYLKNLP